MSSGSVRVTAHGSGLGRCYNQLRSQQLADKLACHLYNGYTYNRIKAYLLTETQGVSVKPHVIGKLTEPHARAYMDEVARVGAWPGTSNLPGNLPGDDG